MNKSFLATLLHKVCKAIAGVFMVLRYRRLYRLTREAADRLDERIYCVKYNGKIQLISRSEFKSMRAKGIFPLSFTADKLRDISLFYMESKRLRKND